LIISIITINLNNLLGLKKTIHSVFSQTYKIYEFIIIDGESTDGSVEYVNQIKDNRISYFKSEKDNGIYDAMNKGVSISKGHYLYFLNSGDIFYNNNVLQQISLIIQSNKADIYYSDALFDFGEKQIIVKFPEILDFDFWYQRSLNHQNTIISKKALSELNGYSDKYSLSSDFKFFLNAFLFNAKFIKVESIIAIYDANGISSTNIDLIRDEHKQILDSSISQYLKKLWLDSIELNSIKKYKLIKKTLKVNSIYQKFKKIVSF